MKKVLSILFCGVLVFSLLIGATLEKRQATNEDNEIIENISEKLIRFHVLANSNTDVDQELKMKVKDEVLKYISPMLEKSESLEESREILKKEDNNIINIAEEFIKKEGFNYSVETTLTRENFPVKEYGNIVLPQGEYEAYRILIGNGQGENWWCVMFPPLCFVDITKGQVSYDKTDKQMKEILSEKEFKAVNKKENEVKFELKVFDLFKQKN
ncbi:stage II sporulation protein R [Clostridium sp.]|uniref:stage II sporulation protein R n=1 Tax=Clostridium sp. TaxID=1506 RepID=UPI0026386AEA|nr:stage II sporulation protein R [Clostridium sp.]